MANPRKPLAKAKVTGRTINNPGRYRGRSEVNVALPIGEPYACMTSAQREAWVAFKSELPWLKGSHRALLQVACVLRARIEAEPATGVNTLQTYSAVLSKLGATPVDQCKIAAAEEEDDPADKFFH